MNVFHCHQHFGQFSYCLIVIIQIIFVCLANVTTIENIATVEIFTWDDMCFHTRIERTQIEIARCFTFRATSGSIEKTLSLI